MHLWPGRHPRILRTLEGTVENLTSEPWTWVPAEGGAIPQGAVLGGSENGQPLFICRAQYNGGVHPGKVVGQNCNIGWGGREILNPTYEVLVR